MKRLFTFLTLALLLAGCGTNEAPALDLTDEIENTDLVTEEDALKDSDSIDENLAEEDDTEDYSVYEKWAFPSDEYVDVASLNQKPDCLGVANGMTYGGDLLSSLIVDQELRARLDLNIYSESYVRSLEKKAASYTQSKHASDIYAFSACNLADGVDLISGHLWPQGEDSYSESLNYDNSILLLVDGASVLEMDDSVRLLNETATGAEVFPCYGALLESKNIVWSCFLGLYTGNTDAVGSNTGKWILSSVDGTIINYEEYSEISPLSLQ